MAFIVSPEGFDGEERVNFDSLGKLYVSIAIVWTAIVVCGAGFLLYHRHLPALRVRNTHLWTTAVTFLHTYWVLCLLAYVINGTYPCTAEYWIMSLWLPFGIALYQVNGMHLLHIASVQTRFIYPEALYAYRGSRPVSSRLRHFRNLGLPDSLSQVQKIWTLVGVMLQVVVSLAIYLVSRKFHGSWGVVGHAVSSGECRRGWEWIPSIAWQFFWAWVYAPCLLWKVRKIHDLHGWRLQTTICCLAGLPGSPMWLLALYSPYFSPGLAKAGRYFVPPLWFTPGIVAMEISVIFIPCIMVVRSHKLQNETRQQLIDWERSQDSCTSVDTGSTYVPTFTDEKSVPSPVSSSTGPIRSELYSMKALEKALTTNVKPLLRFSALKDFSGENISFLKHVQDWKRNWTTTSSQQYHHQHQHQPCAPAAAAVVAPRKIHLPSKPQPLHTPSPPPPLPQVPSTVLIQRQFSHALEIYLSFISPQTSDFPINISYSQLRVLNSVFSNAAASLAGTMQEKERNVAAPFEDQQPPSGFEDDVENGTGGGEWGGGAGVSAVGDGKAAISIASTAVHSSNSLSLNNRKIPSSPPPPSLTNNHLRLLLDLNHPRLHLTANIDTEKKREIESDFEIPEAFGPNVFDDAERAIKYVVLTNTWPRFVGEGMSVTGVGSRASGSGMGIKGQGDSVKITGEKEEKRGGGEGRGGGLWGSLWQKREVR